ncbi:hypothetical protein [Pelagicoccus albus]|uniref:N-acetyltransferase domain-containing protein n=1 Tax=Pelagicoccus albus TaxID=415222 RepID=A0A7X1B6D9_9BACT|nr:hypothetical protein [Pelagicoccus albus]MBC2606476.1 hypothetical protein [Pelagicoccus albus]
MDLDEQTLEEFVRTERASYQLEGLGMDESLVLSDLRSGIKRDFEELREESVCESRHGSCNLAGTKPVDFAEQLVDLGEGRKVICGIRFLGMNLARPFVKLTANFAWESTEQILSTYQCLLADRFAMFSPKWIQVMTPSGGGNAGGSLELVCGALLFAQNKKSEIEPPLELRSPASLDYDWYRKIYDEFFAENPAMRDWVQCNPREEMEESFSLGLLREGFLDGRRIGLIAAIREPYLGHDALYFIEIALEASCRGRGLGAVMQQRFLEEELGAGMLAWGTIDRRNLSSLRTAISNGRKITRGEMFLEL